MDNSIENNTKNKIFNILRWVGLFPLVIIVCFVSNWLSNYLLDWGWKNSIIDDISEGSFFYWIDKTISSVISVIATYQFGIYMAPTNKKIIGVIICILFIVLCVISITIIIVLSKLENWISIVSQIPMIIIAFIIIIDNLKNKEKQYM